MKRWIYIFATLVTCSITANAQIYVDSMMHGGIMRYYRYFVPSTYNSTDTAELVVNMHGYTSNAFQQQAYSNMNSVADTAGFIVVYPDGVNNAWNSFLIGGGSSADDVGFIDALLDTFIVHYNIDTTRMFACGMSNGGFMSYRLACELSDRVAAIASVTGLLDLGLMNTCNPSRPIPVLQIHGTNDPTVPYNGSATFSTVDSTVSYWVYKNNCPTTAIIDSVPDYVTTDNSTAIRYSYQFGDANSRVQLIKIVDGAHTWPGAFITLGTTNQDIDASVEIWKFFSHYSLAGGDTLVDDFPTGVEDILMVDDLVSVYPVPMQTELHVQLLTDEVQSISLYSIVGGLIDRKAIEPGAEKLTIATDHLPSGIYMLYIETNSGRAAYKLVK